MTEETKEQVVEPVQEVQEEKQQEVVEESKQETPAKSQENNWEQVRQVLQAQKQKIEELESRLTQKQEPPAPPEKDEFADLDPDDYLTVSKARKMAESLAEKKAMAAARQMVQEYAAQQNVANDESRARAKYEDYDFVVDNYAVPLIKNDPALAHKLMHSKNPAETAYRLGKLSDSYEEGMGKQQTSGKAEKILKNASRPVSSNAVAPSLKGQAENFSKMSKQQIWEMSEKFARGA